MRLPLASTCGDIIDFISSSLAPPQRTDHALQCHRSTSQTLSPRGAVRRSLPLAKAHFRTVMPSEKRWPARHMDKVYSLLIAHE